MDDAVDWTLFFFVFLPIDDDPVARLGLGEREAAGEDVEEDVDGAGDLRPLEALPSSMSTVARISAPFSNIDNIEGTLS